MTTDTNNKKRLQQLREEVNHATDAELSDTLQADWQQGILPEDKVSDEDLQRVRDEIHQQIDTSKSSSHHSHHRGILRWLQLAAAILLPVCLVGMAYMYMENKQYASMPMTKIVTAEEEQVTVTLPDGTRVSINSLSELCYAPQSFSKSQREVFFQGEGYYKVAKDESHPFVIHSLAMKIQVLGTEFNLVNRKQDKTAELALIDGNVLLTSLVSGKSRKMNPNEIAYLDKQTGDINVKSAQNANDATAWKQKQMIFRDVALRKVISDVEKRYTVDIVLKSTVNEKFTGTLPTNNLEEALRIIAESYGFSLTKVNGQRYILK